MRARSGSAWPLVAAIAWRFLGGGRSRLLDGTARSALAATCVGVMAMVVAMALMTGYTHDLQIRLGGSAAVMAYPLAAEGLSDDAERDAALAALPGVTAVRRVGYGQGSLAGPGAPRGIDVTLRGVDRVGGELPALGELRPPAAPPPAGAPTGDSGALPDVLLGRELSRRLEAGEGEVLRLMVLGFRAGRPRFSYRSVRVAGVFATGFSEFDESWAIVERRELAELMGPGVRGGHLEIGTAEPREAPRVAARVEEILGEDFLVQNWLELNRELFTALRWQKIMLFLVLALIVVVSTFHIASTLVVLVRERMRDLGVLAALGLSPAQLRAVFLLYGGALGVAGAALGSALGCALAWVLTEFELVRFNPELASIYFISSVPFRVRALDLAAVLAFTLGVTLAACWFPARRAGRLQPAVALRYE